MARSKPTTSTPALRHLKAVAVTREVWPPADDRAVPCVSLRTIGAAVAVIREQQAAQEQWECRRARLRRPSPAGISALQVRFDELTKESEGNEEAITALRKCHEEFNDLHSDLGMALDRLEMDRKGLANVFETFLQEYKIDGMTYSAITDELDAMRINVSEISEIHVRLKHTDTLSIDGAAPSPSKREREPNLCTGWGDVDYVTRCVIEGDDPRVLAGLRKQ